jgi:hypothetical protein
MKRLPMREKLVNSYLDDISLNLLSREESYFFKERLHELN